MSNSSASVVLFGEIDKITVKISDELSFDSKSLKIKTSDSVDIESGGKIGFKSGSTNLKDLLTETVDEISGLSLQTGTGIPVIVLPPSIVKLNLLKQKISGFFK
jgi:hypothetical protein